MAPFIPNKMENTQLTMKKETYITFKWQLEFETVRTQQMHTTAHYKWIHRTRRTQIVQHFFGNKRLMKHEAQRFEQFPIVNSYKSEEDPFPKTVEPVPIDAIQKNRINIHN